MALIGMNLRPARGRHSGIQWIGVNGKIDGKMRRASGRKKVHPTGKEVVHQTIGRIGKEASGAHRAAAEAKAAPGDPQRGLRPTLEIRTPTSGKERSMDLDHEISIFKDEFGILQNAPFNVT